MLPYIETPLTTEHANASLVGYDYDATCEAVYANCDGPNELEGCLRTELLAEDRYIVAVTGGLPSEVWA